MRPKSFIGVYMARILKTCEVEETNFHNPFLEFDPSKDIKVGSNPCQPSLTFVFLNTYKWGFHGCEHSLHGILERSFIWLGEGDENNLDNNGKLCIMWYSLKVSKQLPMPKIYLVMKSLQAMCLMGGHCGT